MSACTCSPCGREFTGLEAFDRHQDVNYDRRPAVRCLDPAALGMVQNRLGRWGRAPRDGESHWAAQPQTAERNAGVVPPRVTVPGAAETQGAP